MQDWRRDLDSPIYLLTQSYLVPDGSRELYSGVQRYVRELARLVNSNGRKAIVVQKAAKDFAVDVSSKLSVIGIKAGSSASADPYFNYRAHKIIPSDAPIFYVLLELTYPVLRTNSIAIQHGVWWDGEFTRWKLSVIRNINQRVLRKCKAVICVDTNYINWALENLDTYDLTNQKCKYVPNFVDPAAFDERSFDQMQDGDCPIVLFPRRCEEKRGALIMLDACIQLWKKGKRFKLVFCGWGSMKEEISSRAALAGFGPLVEATDVPFDRMPAMYHAAKVVAIPTVRHEGTSLSCIEAMYMRKAIVVSNVGGLGNLIIPGFNGEVVAPLAGPLAQSIERLLDDSELCKKYANNARKVAEVLTLEQWQTSVWRIVNSSLSLNPACSKC